MLRATAQQKLINVLGKKLGPEYYKEICTEIGVEDLTTPNDSLKFGDVLVQRGGLLESIGRSIKIQAILFGAVEEPQP